MLVALATVLVWVACANGELTVPPPDAPRIDLVLTKTVDNASPIEGSLVTFTIRVRNNGPIAARGVSAADTMPTGLTYVSHDASPGTYAAATGLWTIGELAVGAEAVLLISARVNSGTANTALTNRAGTASSEMNDTVLTNNFAAVSVNVAPPVGPAAGVTFESLWSTATGTGVAALTDGGRWDNGACPAALVLTVVPGGTVGFTVTPNVLRVRFNGGECGIVGKQNAYPQSTTHYVRFYFRNDEVGNRGDHMYAYNNLHSGTGFPIQAAPFSRNAANSPAGFWNATVIMRFPYPYGRWFSPNLTNGVWYRYEYMFEYTSATRYRVWPRIYSLAGTLLHDASNFTNEGDGVTLQQYYDVAGANRSAELGVINGETPSASFARHLGLGNEGPSTASNTNGYYYFAKITFSTAGWIGQ